MIYVAIHLLLGPRLSDFGLGMWQALRPGFLELPGQLFLSPTMATQGQKETERVAGNRYAATIDNSSLVAGKLRPLAAA
jgi:hypothetical protein